MFLPIPKAGELPLDLFFLNVKQDVTSLQTATFEGKSGALGHPKGNLQ